MAAVIGSTQLRVKKIGSSTTIPDNPTAKLMFYFNCVCTCIEADDDYTTRRLQNYNNYSSLSSQEEAQLLILCLALSPNKLIGSIFLPASDNEDFGGSTNRFYELSAVSTRVLVSQSLLVGGQQRKVRKIMKFKKSWIEKYYINPLRSIERRQRPAATSYSSRPAVTGYSSRPAVIVASYSSRPAVTGYSSRPAVTSSSSRPAVIVASYSSRPAVTGYSSRSAVTIYSSRPAVTSSSSRLAVTSSSSRPAVTSSSSRPAVTSSSSSLAVTSSSSKPAVTSSSSSLAVTSSSSKPAVTSSSSSPAVTSNSSSPTLPAPSPPSHSPPPERRNNSSCCTIL